jgi:hypothetical protein
MAVSWQEQLTKHANRKPCENENFQIPETSEEQSKNSETEMVSIIANLPTLMITTPVDVRNEK